MSILGFSSSASATGTEAGTIVTTSPIPDIPIGSTGATPGNLQVTLAAGDVITNGDTIVVTLTDHGNGTTVFWDGPPANVNAVNNSESDVPIITDVSASDAVLTITLGQGPSVDPIVVGAAGQVINITSILYTVCNGSASPTPDCTVSAVPGAVNVNATYGGANPFTFTTGAPASNAFLTTAVSADLKAQSIPEINGTGNGQAAGDWVLHLTGTAGTTAIDNGDTVDIEVGPHSGNATNCNGSTTDDNEIGFASVPSLFVDAGTGHITLPLVTVTGKLKAVGPCTGNVDGINNELVLTFAVTAPGGVLTDSHGIDVDITNVLYDTLAILPDPPGTVPAALGNVAITYSYNSDVVKTDDTSGPYGPSNATVVSGQVNAAGNTPPVDVQFLNINAFFGPTSQTTNTPISNVVITEASAGLITSVAGANYLCVVADDETSFNASTSTPKFTGTNGLTFGPTILESTGSHSGTNTIAVEVLTPSTGSGGTITVSGLAVDASSESDGLATVEYNGSDPVCDGSVDANGVDDSVQLYTPTYRIQGGDADATAIQACEINNGDSLEDANYTVVLATDADYQDALSASYLAGKLDTCILLTPTAAISPETAQALQYFGVRIVDVVGGPDAISNAAYSELESMEAYNPGGLSPIQNIFSGTPYLLQVNRIYGPDAAGTSQAVTQTFPFHFDGNTTFPAAYGGMYNDTTGSSGSPATSAPDYNAITALLATDGGFQDAASASVISYEGLPLLLTDSGSLSPEAAAAITNQGIQQVIVLGGPAAISDNVITQLEALGVTVLRIAGQDYTDTSQLLAQFELNKSATQGGPADGLDWAKSSETLNFARGDFYSDAIVASETAANDNGGDDPAPILLTENPSTLGSYLTKFLGTEGNPATAFSHGTFLGYYSFVTDVQIFGGSVAITPATENAIVQAL